MQERQRVEVDLEVSSVPLESVPYVWSAQIDMIERGLEKGQADWATSTELLAQILKGESHLWVVHEGEEVVAVVVTEVRANRHMTKVFVQLIAGTRLDEWSDQVITLLHDFMELIGADCIEASCRPGLAKFLKGKGWSQKAIIMELK